MPSTVAELCNIALGRIGERQFIASIDEPSQAARTCKVFYGNARDAVLASLPWQFCTGRAVLASTTLERTNWAYVYTFPADCLSARYIAVEGAKEPRPDQRIPYAFEHDTSARRVLVTDQKDAELIYTRQVNDVSLYPPLFVDALAWKLAADLTLGISIKPQVALSILTGYTQALMIAGAADARQSQSGPEPQASYIRARR